MSEELSAEFPLDAIEASERNFRELKSGLQGEWLEALASEVISQVSKAASFSSVDEPSEDTVAELCRALMSSDEFAALEIVQAVQAKGASPDVVYLQYLASASRMLGEWWTEDRVSFAQVSIGVSRIYAIMRGLRHYFELPVPKARASTVFASVPGETHTLGVTMAADLFRRDGWDVSLRVGMDHDELIEEIVSLDLQLIGLSISGNRFIHALSRLVVALHMRLPATPILVSGQSIEKLRPSIDLMGVDSVAETVEEARDLARDLIAA